MDKLSLRNGRVTLVLAASYLLLSGIASLTYQVTWVRLLGLSMGSTSASIGTVLAAFFLGMAGGSYLAERITRNRIHDLRAYIALEAAIGIAGLILLPVLLHLDAIMAWLPAFGTSLGVKFVITLLLLCVPTACMGATFPVMASILIRRQGDIGLRVSQLYSLNTAGAVLGAALSGFVMIPYWGLDGTVFIAVGINFIIVLSALYFNRYIELPPLGKAKRTSTREGAAAAAPLRIPALIALFFTGFVAIATEVGWTKYLIVFAGSTIYGFSAILTVFLLGIALGAWLVRAHLERMRTPQLWMALGLLALGAALLLTRAGLSAVPNIYQAVNHLSASGAAIRGVKYAIVLALLLLPTMLFGALFPLNLKLYCGDLDGVRARIGRAYAVNTIASVLGSVLAGFWLIPQFGTDALLTGMALIAIALPLLFLPALPSWRPRVALAALTLLALPTAWALPHLDYRALIASVGYQYDMDAQDGKTPKFLFLKEGKAGIVSVVTYDGRIAKVQNNGLKESVFDLKDPYNGMLMESLLGLVPYLLHEHPHSAFVVGYGGGVTTRALTYTDLDRIRVVELEPATVEAAYALYPGGPPWLRDARVRVDFNDARNTLLVENRRYDIVAAQPSHPWRAGAANVFTQQFFQLVRSRLNPGGIYAQWVNLFNMDATTLRAIFKAFYNVFPEGMSFANIDTGDYVLIGSNRALQFDYARMAQRMAHPAIKELLGRHRIAAPQDLLEYFALSRGEMQKAAGDAVPNTDTNILSEVRLSALVQDVPTGAEDPYAFLLNEFHADLRPYFPAAIAAQRMYDIGSLALTRGYTDMADKIAAQLHDINPRYARLLNYEILWTAYDYERATELYAHYDDWPDHTRRLQVRALLESQRFVAAERALAQIRDLGEYAAAAAPLYYSERRWDRLAQIPPVDADARAWRILAVAYSSGQWKNVAEVAPKTQDILLLRALLQEAAAHGTPRETDERAAQLMTEIDNTCNGLEKIIDTALKQQRPAYAAFVIDKFAQLSPKAEKIAQWQARLKEITRRSFVTKASEKKPAATSSTPL